MKQLPEKYILWFSEISKKDVPLVGGKNASLGEMFSNLTQKGLPAGRQGINVPDGFALTSQAYWYFIETNGLQKKLEKIFKDFNPQSLTSLQKTGQACRQLILQSEIPSNLKNEVGKFYQKLAAKYGQENVAVAVRTSGVAEDSPTTSFAGQFETFLNVRGEKKLFWAIKESLVSTFTDRAIAYRQENRIPQLKFALSVGVQKMVRSDLASSGIIFTLDTESGFSNVVLINSIYGVGEMIVKGKITPDEFYVFKPTLRLASPRPEPTLRQAQGESFKPIIVKNLGRKIRKYVYGKNGGLKEAGVSFLDQARFSLSEEEILTLAKWACLIEKHYGLAMDIEWAKDGQTNQLFIVQARPETIHSLKEKQLFLEEYRLLGQDKPIFKGLAVGEKIGSGRVKIISQTKEFSQFQKGQVLVAKMTDPDWVPLMRIASAIITDEGGRTCHSAIIARELGIPAIVGTRIATKVLKTGQMVTVDCASGQGQVFRGNLPFEVKKHNLKQIPQTHTKIMVNLGNPQIAFKSSFLPVSGVGLARLEFIIAEKIKIHPLALYRYKEIRNPKSEIRNKFQIQNTKYKIQDTIEQIENLTVGRKNKRQFFVDELAEGIAQIAAGFWPRPVIVRLSDFKSNEYARLIGGELFEPKEENPMIGLRGASRYYDEKFRPAFQLECRAIKKTRDVFGLKNIWLMVPFCRTPEEGKKVLEIMAQNGLEKGEDLKIVVMAEIPSNVILADQFLAIFDGMSIGSNDLTQLVLGLDRDNANLATIGDERNEAVKQMISEIIQACRKKNKYVGICGEAPSNFPDFVEFLIKEGIESISVNPESAIKTILTVAQIENKLKPNRV